MARMDAAVSRPVKPSEGALIARKLAANARAVNTTRALSDERINVVDYPESRKIMGL
jgi:hypothetical protein